MSTAISLSRFSTCCKKPCAWEWYISRFLLLWSNSWVRQVMMSIKSLMRTASEVWSGSTGLRLFPMMAVNRLVTRFELVNLYRMWRDCSINTSQFSIGQSVFSLFNHRDWSYCTGSRGRMLAFCVCALHFLYACFFMGAVATVISNATSLSSFIIAYMIGRSALKAFCHSVTPSYVFS